MWINWISPPIHLSIWQLSMAIFPLSRHCCILGPKSLSRYNFNYTLMNPTDFGELTTAHQALFKTISVPIFLQWQIIYQLGKSSYLDSRIFSQILNSSTQNCLEFEKDIQLYRMWWEQSKDAQFRWVNKFCNQAKKLLSWHSKNDYSSVSYNRTCHLPFYHFKPFLIIPFKLKAPRSDCWDTDKSHARWRLRNFTNYLVRCAEFVIHKNK